MWQLTCNVFNKRLESWGIDGSPENIWDAFHESGLGPNAPSNARLFDCLDFENGNSVLVVSIPSIATEKNLCGS